MCGFSKKKKKNVICGCNFFFFFFSTPYERFIFFLETSSIWLKWPKNEIDISKSITYIKIK